MPAWDRELSTFDSSREKHKKSRNQAVSSFISQTECHAGSREYREMFDTVRGAGLRPQRGGNQGQNNNESGQRPSDNARRLHDP